MPQYCPYLGRETDDVFDREHVFPEAIGGSLDFSISVSKLENNRLGSAVDAPFLNSLSIMLERMKHRIQSSSGDPVMRWVGVREGDGQEVEVTYRPGQAPEYRLRRPFSSDEGPEGVKIITGTPEQADALLRDTVRNNERKGRTVELVREATTPVGPVKFALMDDTFTLQRGLAKITLAGLLYFLPGYEQDPIAEKFRRVLSARSNEEILQLEIEANCLDAEEQLDLFFERLEPHEHGFCVLNDGGGRLVVAVTLFGLGVRHLIGVASRTSTYGLAAGERRIVVCDATRRHTRFPAGAAETEP